MKSFINIFLDRLNSGNGSMLQALPPVLLVSIALFSAVSCEEKKDDTVPMVTAYYVLDNLYDDKQNGTVKDKNNDIMWMKCSVGQEWDPDQNNCTGTGTYSTFGALSMTWCDDLNSIGCFDEDTGFAKEGDAFDACDQMHFAGYDDWRLPSRVELGMLVGGYVDRETFLYTYPQTPDNQYYWSREHNVEVETLKEAWAMSFAESTFGLEESFSKSNSVNYVRCVRSLSDDEEDTNSDSTT